MKDIKKVGIIGTGSLGAIYAKYLTAGIGFENVYILGDRPRIERYRREGLYFNGELMKFNYQVAEELDEKLDFILFGCKESHLDECIEAVRHLVSPETTLASVMNGILSENVLGEAFAPEQVVWCFAQKMAAKKEGNRITVSPIGELVFGIPQKHAERGLTEHFERLVSFLSGFEFPFIVSDDIIKGQWGKLMMNVACNQGTMIFDAPYECIQQPGEKRDLVLGAMREVQSLAALEGINISDGDFDSWVYMLDHFPPDGEPSMLQDRRAKRKSEVNLFSGTVLRLAEKHGLHCPCNERIYSTVKDIESLY